MGKLEDLFNQRFENISDVALTDARAATDRVALVARLSNVQETIDDAIAAGVVI